MHPILTPAADTVGTVSVALGGLLTFAPLSGGRWLALTETDAKSRRSVPADSGHCSVRESGTELEQN